MSIASHQATRPAIKQHANTRARRRKSSNTEVMPASTTGGKTVTKDTSPNLTGPTLTTILATPVEQLTVRQLHQLWSALRRVPAGGDRSQTIGTLLP